MDYRREQEQNQFIEKIKGFLGLSNNETENRLSSEDEFRLVLGIYLFLNVIMYFIMPLGIFLFWISFNGLLYLAKIYYTRGRTSERDRYGYTQQGYGSSTFFENQFNYGGLKGRVKTQPVVEKKQPVQTKVAETYHLKEVRRREKKSIYSRKIGFNDDSSESEDERIDGSSSQFDREYESQHYNALQRLIISVYKSISAAKSKMKFGKGKENQKKKNRKTKEPEKMEIEEAGSELYADKSKEAPRNSSMQSAGLKAEEEEIRKREAVHQKPISQEALQMNTSTIENKESIVKSGTRNIFISSKENKKESLWTKIKKALKIGASKEPKNEIQSEKKESGPEKNLGNSTIITEDTSASQNSALQSQIEMALSKILLKDASGFDGKVQESLIFQNQTKEEVIKLIMKGLQGNQQGLARNLEPKDLIESQKQPEDVVQAEVQVEEDVEMIKEPLKKDSTEEIMRDIEFPQHLQGTEQAFSLDPEESLDLNFARIGSKSSSTLKKKGSMTKPSVQKDTKRETQKPIIVQEQQKPRRLSANMKTEPINQSQSLGEKKRDLSQQQQKHQQQTGLVGKPMFYKNVSEDQEDKFSNQTPFSYSVSPASDRKQKFSSPENDQPTRRIQVDEFVENVNPNSKNEVKRESLFPSMSEVEEKPKTSSLETGWKFGNSERYFQAKAERKGSHNEGVEQPIVEERKIVLNEEPKIELKEEPQGGNPLEQQKKKTEMSFGWNHLRINETENKPQVVFSKIRENAQDKKSPEVINKTEDKSRPPVFSGTSWSLAGNNKKNLDNDIPKQPAIQKMAPKFKPQEEQKREIERFEQEEIEYKPDDYPIEESLTYSKRVNPLLDLPPQEIPEDIFNNNEDTPTFLSSVQTMDESLQFRNKGPQKQENNFFEGIFANSTLFQKQTFPIPTTEHMNFQSTVKEEQSDFKIKNKNENLFERRQFFGCESLEANQTEEQENPNPPAQEGIISKRKFIVPRT